VVSEQRDQHPLLALNAERAEARGKAARRGRRVGRRSGAARSMNAGLSARPAFRLRSRMSAAKL